MNRRMFFRLAGMAASPLLAQTVEQKRRGVGPLKITKVEALVIRTPGDKVVPENLAGMAPLGATTGGIGLWNRLDEASPSRTKGHTQAVLVRITTDQGLIGWGECHAPEAPRVHKTIVTDLVAPVLLGQNALEVEPLWERLYSTERLRGYSDGFYTETIAGVDLALWDLREVPRPDPGLYRYRRSLCRRPEERGPEGGRRWFFGSENQLQQRSRYERHSTRGGSVGCDERQRSGVGGFAWRVQAI